jgi:hypothetical protein
MPALLSNVAFRNALQAMTVTNVTTHYDYPPESLGELPAAFCTFPMLSHVLTRTRPARWVMWSVSKR